MGKSFKPGHSFPTSAGFSGSSGKVASIKPHTRAVGKRSAKIPSVPALSPGANLARPTPALPGVPKPHKARVKAPAMNIGAVLPAGYSRGGPVEKC